ncbi:MAG: DMT family transporter [Proteobacteria bacterium]|nr:DMT family transporter [Pseudomonadota bacterium]
MAVGFGLLAALLWGVADLLIRFTTRRLGVARAMVYGQVPILLIMSAVLLGAESARAGLLAAPPSGWGFGLLSAACSLLGSVCLYQALSRGVLALVASIVASYAAVTTALSLLTGAERLSATVGAGLAICLAGVALASWSRPAPAARSGPAAPPSSVGWALGSALGYGVSFWIQGAFVVSRLGPFAPVWLNAAVSAVCVTVAALLTRRSLAVPTGGAAWLVAATGTIGSLAFMAYLVGLTTGQVAVVTVLSSLAGAVTVLLGLMVLGDRLSAQQWAGVVAALTGVVLLNAAA